MSSVPEELFERMRANEMATQRATDRIGAHEDLCAERYKNINDTLDTIKKIMIAVGGALIVGMAGVLASQLWGHP